MFGTHLSHKDEKENRMSESQIVEKIQRCIGIQHRVKKTVEGEARPTTVFIRSAGGATTTYNLETENDELDFVLGRLPTKWRAITAEEDIFMFPSHHITWIKIKQKDDAIENYPSRHVGNVDKNSFEVASKVPVSYDGMKDGDTFVMMLGGSGNRLAFALANRGKNVGSKVYRIPPFAVAEKRRALASTRDDAEFLTEIYANQPELFYLVRPRDTDLIRVSETLQSRNEVLLARIGCQQRLRQRHIGSVFLSEAGQFPEGSIEDSFDEAKASDTILETLLSEEKKMEKELRLACEKLDVYTTIFEPIEGVGPLISARVIAAVGDIRRFKTDAKLKAFMGAHVLPNGSFPRHRKGEVANWHPDARQALYLLTDQFNKRPASHWGKVLLSYKAKLREKHPEPIVGEGGKKKYTDGHIHKMALWRTATKFVEMLWREWWALEGRKTEKPTEPEFPDPKENNEETTVTVRERAGQPVP